MIWQYRDSIIRICWNRKIGNSIYTNLFEIHLECVTKNNQIWWFGDSSVEFLTSILVEKVNVWAFPCGTLSVTMCKWGRTILEMWGSWGHRLTSAFVRRKILNRIFPMFAQIKQTVIRESRIIINNHNKTKQLSVKVIYSFRSKRVFNTIF